MTPAAVARQSRCSVVEFFRGVLGGSGVERAITGMSSGDRDPLITISHWHDGRRAGQILIFHGATEIVRSAISSARSGSHCGRPDAGDFPACDGGVVIRCFPRSRPPTPGVVVFHRLRPDRTRIGRATTLRGDEIEALSRACDWLAAIPLNLKAHHDPAGPPLAPC